MPKSTRSPPALSNSVETRRRVPRSSREKDVDKLVESTNALPPSVFFDKYCPPDLLSQLNLPPRLRFLTGDAKALKGAVLDQCLALIEITSAADYATSEIKWSPAKKRREMTLPDMRYIVLLYGDLLVGFVSFMVTYEDGREVVYCYEVHLVEGHQGQGIGKGLIGIVEEVGRKVGVGKVMLTVFRSNGRAVGMYERLGYGVDEFSPGPRRLRNGTVKESTYLILSQSLKDLT